MHGLPLTRVGLVLIPIAAVGAAGSAFGPRALPQNFPDRPLARAWAASLRATLAPETADCLRFEVEAHVPPAALEAMLRDAGGDPRQHPRLARRLDDAASRCRRRHGG